MVPNSVSLFYGCSCRAKPFKGCNKSVYRFNSVFGSSFGLSVFGRSQAKDQRRSCVPDLTPHTLIPSPPRVHCWGGQIR